MVEKGFAVLAVMAQSWENFLSEDSDQKESSEKWASGRATIGGAFSVLLQQAWLAPTHQLVSRQLTFCIYFMNQLHYLNLRLTIFFVFSMIIV